MGRFGAMGLFIVNYRLACEHLSPEDVSIYVVALGVVSLLSLFAGFGLPSVALRRVTRSVVGGAAVSPLALFARAGAMIGIGTLLVWLVLIGLLHFEAEIFGKPMTPLIVVLCGWIVARTGALLVSEIARGAQRFGLAAMCGGQQGGLLANALLTALLLWPKTFIDDAYALCLSQAACTGVVAAICALFCTKDLRQVPGKPVAKNVEQVDASGLLSNRSMLWEGSKVLVAQLSVMGLVEYETLLVGRYCDDTQIAAWGAIRRLISLVGAPLLLINAAIPSFITELHGNGKLGRLEQLLRLVSTISTPPAIAAMIVIGVAGDHILGLFRADLAEYTRPLFWLAIANLFFVGTGSAGLVLRMTDHQAWTTVTSIVLSIGYVFAAPWIIDRYELAGAAALAAALIFLRNGISTLLVRGIIGVWCTPYWTPGPLLRSFQDIRSVASNRRRRRSDDPKAPA